METSPLVATLTSTMAIGLTFVLLRLMRQERQRSDARVAALVSLSAQPAAHVFEHPPVKLQRLAGPEQRRRAAPRPAPARLTAADVEIFRDTAPLPMATSTPADLFVDLFFRELGGPRESLAVCGRRRSLSDRYEGFYQGFEKREGGTRNQIVGL